jgi:hypothetical protein
MPVYTDLPPVDQARLNEWIEQMRTTEKPQADGKLCKQIDAGVYGYCCLGLGSLLVPGIDQNFVDNDPDDEGLDVEDRTIVYFNGQEDLAPLAFIHWLGLRIDAMSEAEGYDLRPDFPTDLRVQGSRDSTAGNHGLMVDNCSAAGMNDSGLTFSQIADTFAYFGVGAVSS